MASSLSESSDLGGRFEYAELDLEHDEIRLVVLHTYKPPSCKATYQRAYPPPYQSSHEALEKFSEEVYDGYSGAQSEEHTGKHTKKSDGHSQEEAITSGETEMPLPKHPPM
jgi:hypothetical protein